TVMLPIARTLVAGLLLTASTTTLGAGPAGPGGLDCSGGPLPPRGGARLGALRARPGEPLTRLAFSHRGQDLASGSDDETIRLWETATGKEVRWLTGHTRGVTSLVFFRDDKTLASASEDGTVRLWDVANGKEALQFRGHTKGVRAIALFA